MRIGRARYQPGLESGRLKPCTVFHPLFTIQRPLVSFRTIGCPVSLGNLSEIRGMGDSNMKQRLKEIARLSLVPLLYRYPPSCLAPERLYLYLHYLIEHKDVPGDIVEIGCAMGGTAAVARNMVRRLGINKKYSCYDTFDGFVEQQFTRDVGLGTPTNNRYMFSGSSQRLVAKILRRHNAADVSLIQGDITTIPDSKLPESCSVVLLDIDLAEPTYQTLKRFWPRVAPGGVILVDDCPEEHDWKARIGFSRFCQETGLPEQYRHGMGILVKGTTN